MRRIDKLYQWLAQGPTPDCDEILTRALAHAEPGWSERITDVLLNRENARALAGLIGRYDRLPEVVRGQVLAREHLIRDALPIAMRSSLAASRANAMRVLKERPAASLMYLVPLGLRDQDQGVRGNAGSALRACAEQIVRQDTRDDDGPHEVESSAADRARFVQALKESLRAFEFHHRLEVLEACLWFARELGESLWEVLTARRSRAGLLVSDRFHACNDPRMAGFLLSSLARPAWRAAAESVLGKWRSVEQITAVLRESACLDQPRIRAQLQLIRDPKWFPEKDSELSAFPRPLRPHAPRWVSCLGYQDQKRLELLTRWGRSADPNLHRSAVYALARVDRREALALLQTIARGPSPLARFAKWHVHARQLELVPNGPSKRRSAAPRAARSKPVQEPVTDVDFAMLWQTARRTPPTQRGELIAALRDHEEIWRWRLRQAFSSPDPRDRLLAVQVISTPVLALRFRADLRTLQNDSVDGLRRLAGTLIQSVSGDLTDTSEPIVADEPRFDAAPAPGTQVETARRELRTLLENLAGGKADPTDQTLMHNVRDLLGQVYGETSGVTGAEAVQ